MKSEAKVWILVVTVVVAVGVGIGVWVHYDRVHDQETASLVDQAVSSALAGVTTQPTETTTEPAATEATATTTTTKPTTTKKKKKKKHTTTQPQVVYYTSQGRDVIVQAHRVNDQATLTKSAKSTTKFSAVRMQSVKLFIQMAEITGRQRHTGLIGTKPYMWIRPVGISILSTAMIRRQEFILINNL